MVFITCVLSARVQVTSYIITINVLNYMAYKKYLPKICLAVSIMTVVASSRSLHSCEKVVVLFVSSSHLIHCSK